jgi:hypothetical protein
LIGAIAIGAGKSHSLALISKQLYVRVLTSVSSISMPEGGTATVQVKLSAAPLQNVTITPKCISSHADITTGASLTFTTNNWGTYQTMTLTAAEDAYTEDGSAMITLSGAGADIGTKVFVTKLDNDATLTVGATPGGTTTPGGAMRVNRNVVTPITATPASGYMFDTWTVAGGSGIIANPLAANTTVLIGETPTTLQANFLPLSGNRKPQIVSAARADATVLRLPDSTVVRVAAFERDGDPLTYAWSKWVGPGAVTFSPAGAADSIVEFSSPGTYTLRVTVSDGRGGLVTSDVTVDVKPSLVPPMITDHPFSMTVLDGQYASFAVAATGDDLWYQWYKDGVAMPPVRAGLLELNTSHWDNGAKY